MSSASAASPPGPLLPAGSCGWRSLHLPDPGDLSWSSLSSSSFNLMICRLRSICTFEGGSRTRRIPFLLPPGFTCVVQSFLLYLNTIMTSSAAAVALTSGCLRIFEVLVFRSTNADASRRSAVRRPPASAAAPKNQVNAQPQPLADISAHIFLLQFSRMVSALKPKSFYSSDEQKFLRISF